MHTTHALHTRPEHHDPTLQQLHQHHQQHHPQIQHQNEPTHQNTMTVLETLNPSQPEQQQVMGMIDPVQQQQQQHVVQHVVPQQQPHLHQLQPSHNSMASLDSTGIHMGSEGDQQQQVGQQHAIAQQQSHEQHQDQQSSSSTRGHYVSSSNLLRQRAQIEGIVTDGGGPIVQWLLDNYEIADGESLPRSTVYNHYLAHCRQLQMASVNAASFGKLIRSVFIGLKTRRLGTRGHSKYHYFGVRAKQHIQQELLQHQETSAGCSRELSNNENSNQNTDNGSESDSTGNGMDCGRQSSGSNSEKRIKRDTPNPCNQIYHQQRRQETMIGQHDQSGQQQQIELEANGAYYATNNGTNGYAPVPVTNNNIKPTSNNSDYLIVTNQNHCNLTDFRNHMGSDWITLVDANWPQREDCFLERQLVKSTGSNELADCLKLFEAKYKSYYKRMVEVLSELKFSEVERLWREFWNPSLQGDHWQGCTTEQSSANGSDQSQQQSNEQQPQSNDDISQSHIDYQRHLHQQQQQQQHQNIQLDLRYLHQLTSQTIVIERINQIDYCLYEAIESFLIPDKLLRPIPSPLAQQIRQFAENICPWIEVSVKDYDPIFAAEKSKSARAFGSALRRYESLNRLSTASRAIWEKRSSLAQMSIDLSRVDLRDLEHQVSLMSLHHQTHHLCVMQPDQLIQNFIHLLEHPNAANNWPDWCQKLVESRICGPSVEEATNFVLKWNFYISLIMKDLTLKSAPSFASFLLIKSLFDEYIFYLVETRLAQAQHKKPIHLLS